MISLGKCLILAHISHCRSQEPTNHLLRNRVFPSNLESQVSAGMHTTFGGFSSRVLSPGPLICLKKQQAPPPQRERDRQTDRHMLSKVVMVRRHHRQSICFPRVYTAQPWARHSTDSRCRTHTGRMPWLNSANVKQDQWQPHSLYSDCHDKGVEHRFPEAPQRAELSEGLGTVLH